MNFRYLLILLMLVPVFAQAEVIEIDNAQLKSLMAENVPVIDIRRAAEWSETGIVAGSHMLTFFDANGKYDARLWLAKLASIAAKDDPVVLICRTGRRTGLVSQFIDKQAGYQRVYNVTKGIRDWIDKGNTTVAPH